MSRPPSYLCISEGERRARVANERCNVSVSLAVGQDNDSRSIGGKNIPLSFTRALLSPTSDEILREVIEEGNMYYFRTIEYGPIHYENGERFP